jgi:hypothetical protein
MSYTPTNWETGDVITAEKLNNMEGGIENAQLFIVSVTRNENQFTADKTFAEIQTAFLSGAYIVLRLVNGRSMSDLVVSALLVDTAITCVPQISVTLEGSTLHIMYSDVSMNSDSSLVVNMAEYTVPNANIIPH